MYNILAADQRADQGGGQYMISRSIGPEFEAVICIIYAAANKAVAVSFNPIGFCKFLIDLLASLGAKIVNNGLNDICVIFSVTLIVLEIII